MIICEFRLRCAITPVLMVIVEFIVVTPIALYPKEVGNGTVIAPSVELSWLKRRSYDVITRLANSRDTLVRAQAPIEIILSYFSSSIETELQFLTSLPAWAVFVFFLFFSGVFESIATTCIALRNTKNDINYIKRFLKPVLQR